MYTEVLVRYGDLMIKGKNRKHFIGLLRKRLFEVFPNKEEVHVIMTHDRVHLELGANVDGHAVLDKLHTVFGIGSASLAKKVDNSLESITAAAIEIAQHELQSGMSFKVETKRSYKQFPMQSLEVSQHVAKHIFQAVEQDIHAEMHHPDRELCIEIRERFAYVMLNKIKLAGGFPQGSIGNGALMLSGGIDSPVAGYLALRKGIHLIAVHFASPPYTSTQALDKIKQLVGHLEQYQKHIPLHIVPFTEIQLEIAKNVQDRYQMVVMRRVMYAITQELARKNNCQVLINGESAGQVASQTLESMASVHPISELPIIQPLITSEKNEIIDLAKQLGTYEISILPFEDCCTIFVPKNPVTRPRKHLAELESNKIDFDSLVKKAVEETIIFQNGDNDKNNLDFL